MGNIKQNLFFAFFYNAGCRGHPLSVLRDLAVADARRRRHESGGGSGHCAR